MIRARAVASSAAIFDAQWRDLHTDGLPARGAGTLVLSDKVKKSL